MIRFVAALVAVMCLEFTPAAAEITVFPLPDDSRFFATTITADGTGALAYGVEVRSVAGPFSRTTTSLAVVRTPAAGLADGFMFDSGWAAQGIARTPIWGEEDEFLAHTIDAKGRILVLGRAPDPAEVAGNPANLFNGDPYNRQYRHFYLALFRLAADGTPDRSFNGTGRVVFRLGPFEDNWDEIVGNNASRIAVGIDGTISIFNLGEIARIADDGTLDTGFQPFSDRSYRNVRAAKIAFEPAIEFVNDRDQYFLTTSPDEAGFLDRGGAGRWHRTGHAIRTFVAGQSGHAAQPVCRFYGDPRLGLGNHFFTADNAECDLLAGNPSLGWALESRDVFRLEKPDPLTGACGAGRDAVFRLLALRGDSAHRYTTNWNLARAAVASGQWIKEGFGPDQIAMCALAQ